MSSQVLEVMKAIIANPQNIVKAEELRNEEEGLVQRFFQYQTFVFAVERRLNREFIYNFHTYISGIHLERAELLAKSNTSKTTFSDITTGGREVYEELFNALTEHLNGVNEIFKSILDTADNGI